MLDLKQLILDFRNYSEFEKTDLYNEFSFQHELGIFLRNNLHGYKVQFERNVTYFGISKNSTIKKEIDIVIFNEDKSEKYAIELKFPRNGEYPEQMYAFAKDVWFAEQLRDNGFTHTCVVVLVEDAKFYSGSKTEGIYQYFRGSVPLSGVVYKPTGNGKGTEPIELRGVYHINWDNFDATRKYYIITI